MGLGKAGRIGVVLGGLALVWVGIDFAFSPWAYVGGGPVGSWEGAVVIPKVGRVGVLYRLRHELQREEGPALEGDGFVCVPGAGAVAEGRVTGRVSWLGGEARLLDPNAYGTRGQPEAVQCQVEKDGMACTLEFGRPMTKEMAELSRKAGLDIDPRTVALALRRVEAGRTLPCPAAGYVR